MAAIRWHRGVRILVWWGIFSGMYGLQTLDPTPAVLAALHHALKTAMPYVSTAVMYLLLVSALFAWRELSLGTLRLLIQLQIFAGLAIALIGFGTFVLGGPNDKWIFYNNLLAVFAMLVLLTVVLVPKFSKFLVIPNHRIREAGGVCGRGAPVPCQVYREGPKQGSWGPRVVKRTPQLERGGLNSNIIFTCADFISTPSL